MEIKQILPGDGWVAVIWEKQNQPPMRLKTHKVALWALYDDGSASGLVNDVYEGLKPPSSANFLGYALDEEHAKEFQVWADDANQERARRL